MRIRNYVNTQKLTFFKQKLFTYLPLKKNIFNGRDKRDSPGPDPNSRQL